MRRATTGSFGTRAGRLRLGLFALALLTLAVGALPVQRAAAGGSYPSITAWFSIDPVAGQIVTVRGEGFTPGGSITLWLHNEDWDEWHAAEARATSPSYQYVCLRGSVCFWNETSPGGHLGVDFSVRCPRYVSIYVQDLTTGLSASTRIYDSRGPH